ncbi:hypothetical protein [Polaromonas sp. LjRoot131]|uniref:hypothetical protein n=1 Tax=Polaromonas sp. LjRoot131 TaxID=3342262 RepID=UPI003ECE0D90
MYKIDGEDRWILFVIGVAFATFLACKFSRYFGLSRDVAGVVFSWMAVLAVVTRLCSTLKGDFPRLRPSKTWPFLLALLWMCWWPALDFWAGQSMAPSPGQAQALPWWGPWYARWGVLAGIVALGSLARKILRHR